MPVIFVAAGIGVTPFYSMLKQRVHDGQPLGVTLVYGARTENVPFKQELAKWSAAHPELVVKYAIGDVLTVERLAELEPHLNQSLVYVSGPEPMVQALGAALVNNGLPPEQFKRDEFPNYNASNY